MLIRASMGEPHTSKLNGGISLIYIIMYMYQVQADYLQNVCGRVYRKPILDLHQFWHYSKTSEQRTHWGRASCPL